MFFGRTPHRDSEGEQPNNVQVLQADIVYEKEKELRVVSLDKGLQYLHKTNIIVEISMEVRLAHVITLNLRPVILAAYNSYRYNASHLTDNDPEEVVIGEWPSLTNSKVSEILLEAVRPRTKEKYSQEMILYLGKRIPQSPPVNAENFANPENIFLLFWGEQLQVIRKNMSLFCQILLRRPYRELHVRDEHEL